MNPIMIAANTAEFYHRGQLRKYSQKPYIIHPCRVAGRIMLHESASESLIAAAWCHDLLEDTDISYEELERKIGTQAATWVQELTNPSKGSSEKRAARKKMDREHIANISQEAKLIKLLDRSDNITEFTNDINYTCGLDIDMLHFAKLYAEESKMLLEQSLVGVDKKLEGLLKSEIFSLDIRATHFLGK